ncbi:hypothetical protein V8G54_012574 [Vigna mungo]|uniref:S-protein homolog n=1 Tax=Vigna mungo TaxID=3915 RepID=A0AAQ3NUZ4_VIGMU
MVSISKILLSLLLTTVFSLQLKGSEDEVVPSEVEEGLLPRKVHVAISNFLVSKDLTLHCRDKHNDVGTHILKYGERYDFDFRPNFFAKLTLYYCSFTWVGASHSFDVYNQNKDDCNQCAWNILESGPCKVFPKQCYAWRD